MNIVQLVCPACGGILDIEDELDIFYCKYCGSKLIAENLDKGRLKARVRIAEMRHEERMQQAEHDYLQKENESKREHYLIERELERKHQLKMRQSEHRTEFLRTLLEIDDGFIPVFALIFGPLIIFLVLSIGMPSWKHSQKVADLEQLEVQIQDDIEAGNYDEALAKLNQMTLTDNYSSEDEKTWDKKRGEYFATIRLLIKEKNAANPDYLYAPKSSEELKKLTKQQAVDLFANAGFTNISEIEVPDDTGFWTFGTKAGKVEHVVFGGLSHFTTDDGCMAGDKVVIYYYAEKK